jgi:hypothetical protein
MPNVSVQMFAPLEVTLDHNGPGDTPRKLLVTHYCGQLDVRWEIPGTGREIHCLIDPRDRELTVTVRAANGLRDGTPRECQVRADDKGGLATECR